MGKYVIITFNVILLLLLSHTVTSYTINYADITVDEAYEMDRSETDVIFIDIREIKSFIKENIKVTNTRICVPFWSLFFYESHKPIDRIITLGLFIMMVKGKNVILYCNIGKTSGEILTHLSGYTCYDDTYFYNMVGGIEAWKEAGYPLNDHWNRINN